MSDYMHKEYKLPNGRTVIADFNDLGQATITIQAMDALFDIINSSDVVEVVRCKDCIYYETCNLRSSHWWKGGYTVDIKFCSFGERTDT